LTAGASPRYPCSSKNALSRWPEDVISPIADWIRRHAAQLAAVACLGVLYGFAKPPELPVSERRLLAADFGFDRIPLPESAAGLDRRVRAVHPDVEHLSAWISAVGAAVSLHDLDGDGLANDLCLVDARTDEVLVTPAPRTGERYERFVLDPAPLPYDRRITAPMGCEAGDLNEDGWLDLVVYYWGRPPVAFLRRLGDSGPIPTAAPSAEGFRPIDLVPGGGLWNTNAMTQADLDGDGHVDLVIGNYYQDGTAVLDPEASGRFEMQDSFSRAVNAGLNRFLLWAGASAGPQPEVRFVEITDALSPEVAGGWTLAAATGDLDGDLLPEVYFANDFGQDRLLHNRSRPGELRLALVEGRRTLDIPASKVLGRDSFKSMGVEFSDLDGDARPDILVSNITHDYGIHESHFTFLGRGPLSAFADGVAPFVDSSEPLGLARSFFSWEIRSADFNNDSVPEVVQATGFVRGDTDRWAELQELALGNDNTILDPRSWPNFRPGDDLSGQVHVPFFVRSSGGRYFDLAGEIDGLGQRQLSRGIATGDVDGDGDLDMAIADQWETSYLYVNRSRSGNRSLVLRPILVSPTTSGRSRPAIGARAIVHLPDGRLLTAEVDGGSGHSGARSHELHFGLGRVPGDQPLTVELHWRDADGAVRSSELRLAAGRHIVELGTEARPVAPGSAG